MDVATAGPTNPDAGSRGIALFDASVRFGAVTAISDVTITLKPGRSLALVGSNGSGKSTVLNVIAGLLLPSTGTRTADNSLRIAYVPQRQARDHWMPLTAREVLRMGRFGRRGLLGSFKGNDWMAVGEAASRLQVTDILDRQFGELSGGQQQRVVVAQALAGDPDVLLLDEPLNGLDPPSQETILQLITDLAAEGVAVAVATHDLDDARKCDEVALMDTSLHAIGAPDDVLIEANLEQIFGGRFHRV